MKKDEQENNIYCGVDCSKLELVVYLENWRKTKIYINNQVGITQLIEELKNAKNKVIVVCESSGGYERKLLYALYCADIGVAHINARQSYHFAKSEGLSAKTDDIDAKMLMKFGIEKKPILWKPREQTQEMLRALILRRKQLNDILKKEKNHLENIIPELSNDVEESIVYWKHKIQIIDKRIQDCIHHHEPISNLADRLIEVKGFGPVCVTTIIGLLPELGKISDKQISHLAGLAPINSDSGACSKARHIKDGRNNIRECLFMAAKSAARHNSVIKPFYQRLKAKGKPSKVIYTAIMRKLLVLANKIAADPSFTPAS